MLWNGLKTDTYDVYLFSFYCESNELGKLRCPDLCLLFSYVLFFLTWFFLISFCLTWFFPVSVFLILFCLTWFSPSGLRFSRIMVLVSGLCLKKFDWLRPQVNWYKKLQDAPLAAVVGRLCRLPCWLVDIPECEVLLLNYIEMFANVFVGSSPYWCFPLHVLLHDEALVVIAVQVEADTFIIAREEMNMSFENRNTARMEN